MILEILYFLYTLNCLTKFNIWVLCIFKHFLHWVYIETPWFPSIEQSIAIHCLWTLVINAKFLSFKLHGITDKHWSQNINHNGLECYKWFNKMTTVQVRRQLLPLMKRPSSQNNTTDSLWTTRIVYHEYNIYPIMLY